MTRDDIIKMAREAGFMDTDKNGVWITDGYWDDELRRFAALVAAAEREKQEPVAWVCYGISSDEKHSIDYEQAEIDAIPVGTMLYTTPPAREWVGLTDDDYEELLRTREWGVYLIEAVEAKLKEKNGG